MVDRGKLMPKLDWYINYCAEQTESREAELRRLRDRIAEMERALAPFDTLEGDLLFEATDTVILATMARWRHEDKLRRKYPSHKQEQGEGIQARNRQEPT